MTSRTRLPNRRSAETFNFTLDSLHFVATVGRFEDGNLSEVFLNSTKSGSAADANAADAATAASLALQYGCPMEVLRSAMKRNPNGSPQGPLGAALDTVRRFDRQKEAGVERPPSS